jgi:hypothetical protein
MLTPPGETPDGELREALNRPDLHVTGTDNEYVALAEVCAACRHDVERMKAGSRGAGLILLLAYPQRLSDPAGLVHAAERYAPQTAVWMFDPASVPRLRAVKVEDLASWERATTAAQTRPAPTAPMGGPALAAAANPRVSPGRGASNKQLSAIPAPDSVDPRREAGKDRQDGGLLSEEELAMLLAVESPGVHNEHDRPS